MNSAFWRFYKDIATINIPISLAFILFYNLAWALVVFCSFGIFLGLVFFRHFKKNEYYLYHNLGFTKMKLIQKVFIFNFIIALPILLLLK